jgi:hypothetical protein
MFERRRERRGGNAVRAEQENFTRGLRIQLFSVNQALMKWRLHTAPSTHYLPLPIDP